jgi:zinc/manganese transport system permease protein
MASLLALIFEPGLFTSEPVRSAAMIGGSAAIVSGAVGVFTVIRGQSFAGHSLADISSAGGAAAFLIGINPLLGFLAMGVVAAACMELFGVDRASERDLVTGVVTGAGLGLSALLLYLVVTMSSSSGATIAVMFGSMFTIPASIVPLAVAVGVGALGAIGLLYRPLLLCSLDRDLAAVRGVPVRLVGFLHLIVTAMAVALSAITVGAILSTALLIGPAAIALHLSKRPGVAILLASAIGGHGWPVSFCIVALVFAGYVVVSRTASGRVRSAAPAAPPAVSSGA